MSKVSLRIVPLLVLALLSPAVRAELAEINVAQQYGIGYLSLMMMEEQKLIEKHAKAAGLDVKVNWAKFAGGNVMNDALLSGSLQFASGGVGPLITIWAKTKGNLDVKGVAALDSMPLYLNTRNPNVKSVKDFTEKDRIALPAVKVSVQAVTLQMAAEKAFGEGQHGKLDAFIHQCRRGRHHCYRRQPDRIGEHREKQSSRNSSGHPGRQSVPSAIRILRVGDHHRR